MKTYDGSSNHTQSNNLYFGMIPKQTNFNEDNKNIKRTTKIIYVY
jgi:hypothetical protein